MKKFLWYAWLLGALDLAIAFADDNYEVNVNVSVMDAGRKFVPPSKEHPLYYVPFFGRCLLKGPPKGETEPQPDPLVRACIAALAPYGYVVSGPKKEPPPSVILFFQWGRINRDIEEEGSTETSEKSPSDQASTEGQRHLQNGAEFRALVSGTANEDLWHMGFFRNLESELQDDRGFVWVAAFDYAAAQKGKWKLLWISRMSTPMWVDSPSLDALLPKLIAAGAPFVGRETKAAQHVNVVVPQGKVELGPTVVLPDVPIEK